MLRRRTAEMSTPNKALAIRALCFDRKSCAEREEEMAKKREETREKTRRALGIEVSPEQTRREALRKFGRYAAVAPMTMMLLEPHSASATHKGKHPNSHY
jgi:hypothetical protein